MRGKIVYTHEELCAMSDEEYLALRKSLAKKLVIRFAVLFGLKTAIIFAIRYAIKTQRNEKDYD